MIRIILACALLCALTINAEARQRHKAAYLASDQCNLTGSNSMPCEGVAPSPRGERIAKAVGFGAAQKVYTPRVSGWNKNVNRNAFFSSSYPSQSDQRVRGRLRFEPSSYGAPSPSFVSAIARPARYIAGRLICAVNVGAALAERGIKGTGSALALSYLHWGRSAGGPVPGAVIVSSRSGGGHVAIVSRVENGIVYAWNATGGQSGWREIPYRHHVIDYRVPG